MRFSRFLSLIFALHALAFPARSQDVLEQAMLRQGLVDIQKLDPSILVDLKYSTRDNFVGKDVYGDLTRAYLQPMAARKLAQASRFLQQAKPNYRLLVYDAARPRTAQWNLWKALPNYSEKERQKYVADPRIGSIHNYGCAVDLTLALVNGRDGKPMALDMGTPFDYFGHLAYPEKEEQLLKAGKLTRQQVENRRLLRSVMRRAGFSPIETEWWHFNAISRAKAKQTYKIVE
ncbi:M15 family metallopeptidase [Tellurirhabdus rosea]|uniref:M15 family metallopeptidase n=1 Tax=Tellurirhabdus rosea TaxID=2674997 RepID=UPI002258592B|nr:M15 family metallopeptidase [Tellurirhabdus rosea]